MRMFSSMLFLLCFYVQIPKFCISCHFCCCHQRQPSSTRIRCLFNICQQSRHIVNREIGVPKVKINKTSEAPKSRHNRDRPSERTRGRRLVPSLKGPIGGRSSANRKSRYQRSRAQRFCAFRNRDPRNLDE
jgi:hypothetical protein